MIFEQRGSGAGDPYGNESYQQGGERFDRRKRIEEIGVQCQYFYSDVYIQRLTEVGLVGRCASLTDALQQLSALEDEYDQLHQQADRFSLNFPGHFSKTCDVFLRKIADSLSTSFTLEESEQALQALAEAAVLSDKHYNYNLKMSFKKTQNLIYLRRPIVTDTEYLEQLKQKFLYVPDTQSQRVTYQLATVTRTNPLEALDLLKYLTDEEFVETEPVLLYWTLSDVTESNVVVKYILKRCALLPLPVLDKLFVDKYRGGRPDAFKLRMLAEADRLTAPPDTLLNWALGREELAPITADAAVPSILEDLHFELARMKPEFVTPLFLHYLEPRGIDTLVRNDDLCRKCLRLISGLSPEQRRSHYFFFLAILKNTESFGFADSRVLAVEAMKEFAVEEKTALLEYLIKHITTDAARILIGGAVFDVLRSFDEIHSTPLVQFVFEHLLEGDTESVKILRQTAIGEKIPWSPVKFHAYVLRREKDGAKNPIRRAQWSALSLPVQMWLLKRFNFDEIQTVARVNPTVEIDYLSFAKNLLEEKATDRVIFRYLQYFGLESAAADNDPEHAQELMRNSFNGLYFLISHSTNPTIVEAIEKQAINQINQQEHPNDLTQFLQNFQGQETYQFVKKCSAKAAYLRCNTTVNYSGETDLEFLDFDYPQYFELMAETELPELELELLTHFPSGMTIENIAHYLDVPDIGLRMLNALHDAQFLHFQDQVLPIIHSQGDAAFLYLEKIKEAVVENPSFDKADIDVMVFVSKKYQVKARNILENLLMYLPHPGAERESVEAYLQQIGLVDVDIYLRFKQLYAENNQEAIDQLTDQVKQLKAKVIDGPMTEEDFHADIYSAVIFDTFPPAVGLTQNQYVELNQEREDRQSDVPSALDPLQHLQVELSTGTYRVTEGEELDLDAWKDTSQAIRKVNGELQAASGKIAFQENATVEELSQIYLSRKTSEREASVRVIELMYRYHLHQGGAQLEAAFSLSLAGLMNYKEFVGERVRNDLIWKCVQDWGQKHPEELGKLLDEVRKRVVDQLVGKLFNYLQQLKRAPSDDFKEVLETRILTELAPFGLPVDAVRGKRSSELQQILTEAINQMEQSDSFLIRCFADAIVDPMNKKMRKETVKFSFESSTGVEEKLPVEYLISKRREHGVAGYNMGVCVTPDQQLWEDPTFFNVILFSRQEQSALGGMHILIREGHLCLPGINPSMDLLSRVDAEELFDNMIDYAREIKNSLGLQHILIPVSSSIHSNRTAIQQVISRKNYRVYQLDDEAAFSYHPYEYSFEDCYLVE